MGSYAAHWLGAAVSSESISPKIVLFDGLSDPTVSLFLHVIIIIIIIIYASFPSSRIRQSCPRATWFVAVCDFLLCHDKYIYIFTAIPPRFCSLSLGNEPRPLPNVLIDEAVEIHFRRQFCLYISFPHELLHLEGFSTDFRHF